MSVPAPPTVGLGQVLRRIFGIGRITREGTITRQERFRLDGGNALPPDSITLGSTPGCRWLYLDGADEPAGWIHDSRMLQAGRTGERVRLKIHPEDGYIGSIRPLDRRIGWWQR